MFVSYTSGQKLIYVHPHHRFGGGIRKYSMRILGYLANDPNCIVVDWTLNHTPIFTVEIDIEIQMVDFLALEVFVQELNIFQYHLSLKWKVIYSFIKE